MVSHKEAPDGQKMNFVFSFSFVVCAFGAISKKPLPSSRS